jgi:hypothetical protein
VSKSEASRRADKAWRERNPEHAKALDRAKAMRHYNANRETVKTAMRARAKARWAAMSPDERRCFKLRQAYKITLAAWTALLDAQQGRCAVCRTDEPGKRGWQTDHCHTTKRVRGILCMPCNIALGVANDDPARLRALAAYLESSLPGVKP